MLRDILHRPSASRAGARGDIDDDYVEAEHDPDRARRISTALLEKQAAKSTEETPAAHPQLLTDFAAKFPDAAKLIIASPAAMRFVRECGAAGAKFGGFAEELITGQDWPFTLDDMVFIPKGHSDPTHAMSDFLFELNNAIRFTPFNKLRAEAKKGSKGSLNAKTYARRVVELEVEGMLKSGEVWLKMKQEAGKEKDKTWSAYDRHFYLAQYESYQAGKLTKDDIIDGVLQSKYSDGNDAGKTVEQFYMAQYDANARSGSQ